MWRSLLDCSCYVSQNIPVWVFWVSIYKIWFGYSYVTQLKLRESFSLYSSTQMQQTRKLISSNILHMILCVFLFSQWKMFLKQSMNRTFVHLLSSFCLFLNHLLFKANHLSLRIWWSVLKGSHFKRIIFKWISHLEQIIWMTDSVNPSLRQPLAAICWWF